MQVLNKATADERLRRFQGEYGVTKGLNHDEMIELFQYLVDSGEAYELEEGTQYHIQAWAEAGYLAGVDVSRLKV